MVVPGRLWVGLWDRAARIAVYTGVLPSLIRMRSLVQIQVGPPPVLRRARIGVGRMRFVVGRLWSLVCSSYDYRLTPVLEHS